MAGYANAGPRLGHWALGIGQTTRWRATSFKFSSSMGRTETHIVSIARIWLFLENKRATKMTEKLKAEIERLLDERRKKMDRLLEPRWRVTGQASTVQPKQRPIATPKAPIRHGV
jgi:uncharacterized damage-inducible protein DinB